MLRKELHTSILLLIEQADVDPGKKEILISGVNKLFIAYGKAWLRRNAKNIGYVSGQILKYSVVWFPKLLKFIKR